LGRGGAAHPPHPSSQGPCRSGRPRAQVYHPEPTPGRRRRPAQVMVGRMPPTLPLTTCALPCHSLGAQHAYLLPDRQAILRNRRSLAGQAIEPGPLPERLHDDGQVRPDVAAGPARPALAQRPGSGSERLPEPFAGTAGRPDHGPGRVAVHRRAP
jgi:hypothetical protein